MASEVIPLIALTFHTIANSVAHAEGDRYTWPEPNVARNLIVCGFADFDPAGAVPPERQWAIINGVE